MLINKVNSTLEEAVVVTCCLGAKCLPDIGSKPIALS